MTHMYVAQMTLTKSRYVEIAASDRATLDQLVEAVTAQGIVDCTVLEMEELIAPQDNEGDLCMCPQCQCARAAERRY